MILAGGQGDRLSILSEERAKPAVPFGGRYRIIDFALSNCVNSGIHKVGVLTQYRPRSLNEHIGIGRAWDLDRSDGGVSLLQPYLGREDADWYSGTADAVYQNLFFIEEYRADFVLVLAGDHIYQMAYDDLVEFHRVKQADVTVGLYEVPIEEAHRFGIVTVDDSGRVVAFDEKPAKPKSNLVSMGIYVFSKDVIIARLSEDAEREGSHHDFGRDIIPHMIASGDHVFGYRFQGYWRDVGTIDALWRANMDLLEDVPELNLYQRDFPLRTKSLDLPPAKVGPWGRPERSLLSEGCIVNGFVYRSVLSPGVYVERDAVIRDSVIFNDCRIERGANIERCIIDKEVRVGEWSCIGFGDDFTPNRQRPDLLDSGLTIVGKRAHLPPYIRVGRNCLIGPGVGPEQLPQDYLPSGETVRLERGRSRLHV